MNRHEREMAAAARALGRPGAADAVAELVLALAASGAARLRAHLAGRLERRSVMHAAPTAALTVGTDIQRRIGVKTSREEPLARFTTMRVGGPADLFARCTTSSSCAPSSASRAPARCPTSCSGAGATS